jgi:hypothetical protein
MRSTTSLAATPLATRVPDSSGPDTRLRWRLLAALILGLLAAPLASGGAIAAEPAPGCIGLGIGLLNSYFDLPWSGAGAGKFAAAIQRPSAAAYWGVEQQNDGGRVTTNLSSWGGIKIHADATGVALFQPVEAPRLVPGYAYVLVDVLARVFVKDGVVAISLSTGPASYAAAAYPRSPFRTTVTGQWTTIGEQVVLGANSPAFDRVSILSLTPSAEFSIGCITFISHERNIGLPDANPLTKGAMAPQPAIEGIMPAALRVRARKASSLLAPGCLGIDEGSGSPDSRRPGHATRHATQITSH